MFKLRPAQQLMIDPGNTFTDGATTLNFTTADVVSTTLSSSTPSDDHHSC